MIKCVKRDFLVRMTFSLPDIWGWVGAGTLIAVYTVSILGREEGYNDFFSAVYKNTTERSVQHSYFSDKWKWKFPWPPINRASVVPHLSCSWASQLWTALLFPREDMESYTPFFLLSFYSCPASILENTSCPSGDITRVKTQYIIVRNGIMYPY